MKKLYNAPEMTIDNLMEIDTMTASGTQVEDEIGEVRENAFRSFSLFDITN